MSSTSSHHVAILGCGVIGLSTALAILEGQQQNPRAPQTFVTIVSKEVPDVAFLGTQRSAKRKPTAEYASVWAGAHHVSDAKTERELRHDKVTFERISKLARAKPWAKAALQPPSWGHSSVLPITGSSTETVSRSYSEPEPLVWAHQTELFERAEGSQYAGKAPYEGVLDWYPDFKPLPSTALPKGIGWGCTFSTLDINVPVYHKWLLQRFIGLGGRLIVAEAASLSHAIRLASSSSPNAFCKNPHRWSSISKVDVLVASPGLGARTIDGLRDEAVHPQRGQVVVVGAPWLSTNLTLPIGFPQPRRTLPGYSIVRPQGGREVYVIPRGDGTVVCGGTRIVDDWDGTPRQETTKRILGRCLELVPQLVDPKKGTGLTKPRIEDLDVVEVNVGLRPARRGGVRLERAKEDVEGVKIVYNYGYGGAGYQASWGAALEAKRLVEEALGQPTLLVQPVKL